MIRMVVSRQFFSIAAETSLSLLEKILNVLFCFLFSGYASQYVES